jgi:hypothetical protein
MPASSQPFAPSLHSESPSASTDHHDNGAGIDHSLAASNASHHSNMQSVNEFRPQSSEQVYKGMWNILQGFWQLAEIKLSLSAPDGKTFNGR